MARKKLSRREFLQLTALTSGGVLLASCQKTPTAGPISSPEASETVPTKAPGVETTTILPEPEEANIDWQQFKGTKIRFLGASHPSSEMVATMAPAFTALTGIEVETEIIAWDLFFQKIVLEFGSPEPQYDLVLANDGDVDWSFGPAGVLAPVNEFLDDANLTDKKWFDYEDISPGYIAASKWDGIPGHQAGTGPSFLIPAQGESYCFAYRDDLMQKYGLNPPTTLEDIASVAKVIKEGEGDSISAYAARGSGIGLVAASMASFMRNYGAADFDENMNCLIASEESQYLHDLFINKILRPYAPPELLTLEWPDLRQRFADGQYAMVFDCDWFAAGLEDPAQSKVAGKLKYLNLGSAQSKYVDAYYFGYVIPKNSKNKKAAWLLSQFLTSKKVSLERTVKYANLMPTRISTTLTPEYNDMVGGWGGGTWADTINANMEKWTAPLNMPITLRNQFWTIWSGAIVKIFEGEPVKDSLETAVSDVNTLMDKAGVRS